MGEGITLDLSKLICIDIQSTNYCKDFRIAPRKNYFKAVRKNDTLERSTVKLPEIAPIRY
jgi:hypothetical protein